MTDSTPNPSAVQGATSTRHRSVRRGASVAAGALVVALLALVAFLVGPRQQPAVPAVDPDTELIGNGLVFQYPGESSPHLCMGAVAESYPPQCQGPTLRGDFDWGDVAHSEASGTRWTETTQTVQGYFDPEDGELGSFTLTRPVIPAPAIEPPPPLEFPQLCDDPLRGADAAKTDEAAMTGLHEVVAGLPLVTMWVSDGQDAFNIRVRGDAEAAFAKLREVWGGELCVEASDEPTEAERMAAIERITAALPAGQLLHASPGSGTSTTLEVGVLVATPQIVEATEHAAGPGVEVVVTGQLKPVEDT